MGLLDALRDFGQGASNAVASNISAPVDGLAWLLRKGGLPIPANPVGGSDWMAQRGLTAEPTNKLAGLLGEAAGGVGPMLAGAYAPKLANGLLKMGENAAAPKTLNSQTGAVFVYPQDAALAKAQANAALPIEQGGLGLHPNNTAAERAKAMGFDTEAFHGTNADIKAFDPLLSDTRRKTGTPSGAVVVSSNPATASTYAGEITDQWGNVKQYLDDGNVMPLNISKGKNMAVNAGGENWNSLFSKRYPEAESTNDLAEIARAKGKDSATIKKVLDNATWSKQNGVDSRIGDSTFLFDPANIRSRFAAFDPMRRNEADLLGRADPNLLNMLAAGGLLGLGGYKAISGD